MAGGDTAPETSTPLAHAAFAKPWEVPITDCCTRLLWTRFTDVDTVAGGGGGMLALTMFGPAMLVESTLASTTWLIDPEQPGCSVRSLAGA